MKFARIVSAIAIALVAFCSVSYAQDQEKAIEPSGTIMYAQRDTCNLFMDVYNPAPGSVTSIEGVSKPTIIFVFGGGFIGGERNNKAYLPWFKMLSDNGYRVFSIDYRLGLKGAKNVGVTNSKVLADAIHMAMEDLYSAVNFILDNADELGVQRDNIVISGSSAGAITALQADWELCNRTSYAQVLPADFRFAGVMSFSGAIFSDEGLPKYKTEPAPTLLLHGTDDKLVPYNRIKFLNLAFAGTNTLAKEFLAQGYSVNVLRFKGHGHEIANNMIISFPDEIQFLETNVMKKQKRIVDSMIDDPSIPVPSWAKATAADLYK